MSNINSLQTKEPLYGSGAVVNNKAHEIAVIGVGLKFPACENLEEYWYVLNNGINCVGKFKGQRREQVEEYADNFLFEEGKKRYLPGAYLETIDEFDHEYFKIPPREASLMDPVQRLFMQTVIKTFEDAGYSASMLKKTKTGIFVGYTACSFKDNYAMDIFMNDPKLLPYSLVGNMAAIIPARISHLLDLKGPTMVIDTACSSSLVAIYEACHSIINGASEMAIAGGIKIHLLPIVSEYFRLGIESSDGKTRTFDALADGSGIGEGVATVLLKPLEQAEKDQDHIYGVIKGCAVNSDGTALGLTAPNPGAQTQVILDAWAYSGTDPEKVEYIETHGTGTTLGDPIEIQGLHKAFQRFTSKKQFCALGSVKSNFGHLYECAGMASFIKVLLAIEKALIPATLNFARPNEKINFINSPFYINAKKTKWHPEDPRQRVAGVSAFGLSGTNCHLILSGYQRESKKTADCHASRALLTVSAKSPYSLDELVRLYCTYVEENYDELDLHQFCYQANRYRDAMKNRIALVVANKKELLAQLRLLRHRQSEAADFAVDNKELRLSRILEQPHTKAEHLKRQRSMTQRINSILKNAEELTDSELSRIGEFFVDGGTIDWDLFYQGVSYEKLPLPAYPFTPHQHWLPIKSKVSKTNIYYQKTWVPRELETKRESTGQILVIDPCRTLPERFYQLLSGRCEQVIKAEVGDDYDFRAIFGKHDRLETVVLSCPFSTTNKEDPAAFLNDLPKGLYVLLELYQSLPDDRDVKIVVLSDCGYQVDKSEEDLNTENTVLYGFGKCMKRENKRIRFTFIDKDRHTDEQGMVDEVLSSDPAEIVVYRNGRRLVEGITNIDVDAYKDPPEYQIYDEGVYLITGGLGGIGFEAAKLLCKKAKNLRLVLLNRTVLPERSQWNTFAHGDAGDGSALEADLVTKIERLQELEKIADAVDYYPCDVADLEQVQTVVEQTVQKYGKINGIIHGAGVGGDSAISGLTKEKLDHAVAAKIQGTWILDFCTRNYDLDFFLMFSSIATVFSGINLAAYTAANTYLDAFSGYFNKYRKGHATTINWSTWSQTGMSVQHDFTIDTLFKTINTSDGTRALDRLLGISLSNVIVGELNLKSKISLMLKNYPIQLSDDISSQLEELTKPRATKEDSMDGHEFKILGGGLYKKIETEIGKICSEILGYDEIGVNESFFELGADSITLNHIYNKLNAVYPSKLQVTDLFSYPSIAQLSRFLASKEGVNLENEKARSAELEPKREKKLDQLCKDVAVIGVAFNFPGAESLKEYWHILINGIDTIKNIPPTRSHDMKEHFLGLGMDDEQINFRKCSYLEQINRFDYELFKISPHEAQLMDPVARMFLQCCWRAMEDSGYGGEMLSGSTTGVFLGYSANMANSYSRLLYETDLQLFAESLALNQVSMAASRIAYVKDLKGPSLVVDTACSSALVAIHTACEQIKSGVCDTALAGGAYLFMLPLDNGMRVGYESPENKTRPFAKGAEGSAVGEGMGVVLLKSLDAALEDNDSIYAVIKGSAMNQDGSSFGIAAPNYLAQSEVIRKAWENAGIDPQTISYIEAHGTGTQLGDTIEIKGIQHAFEQYTDKKQFCAVGSVKSNLGHLNEAAGMTGFIKLLLMLEHRQIPPTLHFIQPNQNIDFCNSSLYTAVKKRDWRATDTPLRAGISGFGMSGTNCHIVVEEPPTIQPKQAWEAQFHPLLLSAKNLPSLTEFIHSLRYYLTENKDSVSIDQVCSLMSIGRSHFKYRVAILAADLDDLLMKLQTVTRHFPDEIKEDWFFYGMHHIVPENKKNRQDADLTTLEQTTLTHQAQELVKEIRDIRDAGSEVWLELLNMYIKGAEVPWRNIYPGKLPKVHLPTYPMAEKYVWLPYKQGSDHAPDGLFHAKRWENEALDLKTVDKGKKVTTIVIFYHPSIDFTPVTALLKERNIEVIEVFFAEGYQRTGQQFFMDCSPDSMVRFFQEIKDFAIDTVLFTQAIYGGDVCCVGQLNERLETGFFRTIAMIQGLAKAHYKKDFELVFLCQNAFAVSGDEAELHPEGATVIGLGKAIEQEFPTILCRVIDIGDDWVPVQIINEVMSLDTKPYLVGLRKGERYVEVLDEIAPEQTHEMIRKDGNYLITGGTSGLGLETAKYLSEKGCRNIVIVARSPFPEEKDWPSVAAENKDFAGKLSILREIQQNGARLHFYSGDVSDQARMAEIIKNTRKTIGGLHGLFHSAGIAGAGFILRKEKKVFQSILNPKVNGTWILDEVTKEEPLDFMMLYSSGITYTGEAGQSDYIAANSYLDAYADYRNKKGRKTHVINWVSWKETGMAVRHGINFDDITKALPTKEAIFGLDTILRSGETRVMVGRYNLDPNSINIILNGRYRIARAFKERLRAKVNKTHTLVSDTRISSDKLVIMPHSDKRIHTTDLTLQVTLLGKEEGTYSPVEEKLARIYSMTLGFQEIDVYDNFFEMGGDSIMLTKMHQRIEEEYPGFVTTADLFEFTSISSLAQYIEEQNEQSSMERAALLPALKSAPEIFFTDPKTGVSIPTYALSSAQKRIFIESKFNRDKTLYNNPFAFAPETPLEPDQLKEGLEKLVQRHEALRTGFVLCGKEVRQAVFNDVEVDLRILQADSLEEDDFAGLLTAFDLATPPLFRMTILNLAQGRQIVFFDVHHIIVDGYSSSILIRDLLAFLNGQTPPEAPYQYRHYVQFQVDQMNLPSFPNRQEYWLRRLEGVQEKSYLPYDLQQTKKISTDGETIYKEMEEGLEVELNMAAKQGETTLFSLLIASFYLHLYFSSGEEDLVIGVPVLGREHADFMDIVGMFVNTLPVRTTINGQMKLADFIAMVSRQIWSDLKNQSYPYDKIVEMRRKRGEHTNLFSIMFEYENESMSLYDRTENKGMGFILPLENSKYDLNVSVCKKNGKLYTKLDYKKELYSSARMSLFFNQYYRLLKEFNWEKWRDRTIDEIKELLR